MQDFYTLRKEVEIVTQRVEEIRASAGVQQLEEELSVLEKNAADRTVLGSSRRRFVFYIENVCPWKFCSRRSIIGNADIFYDTLCLKILSNAIGLMKIWHLVYN
ncbi:hypothetical protein Sjap_009943 [Stephania japonica]|uniref:Uncharacterized protein n=1 Tax=Stephania japonica TaxID=461633 RepID=A0AAP0J8K7_9MAGN